MYFFSEVIVISIVLLAFSCHAQTFNSPFQRRHNTESSLSATAPSYYSSLSNGNYGSSTGLYRSNEQSTTKKSPSRPYKDPQSIISIFDTPSSPVYNQYKPENYDKIGLSKSRSMNTNGIRYISKADADNAKFVGAENQENDEDGRTFLLKRKKFHRRFGAALINPCSNGRTRPIKGQGRFLWDINVYNVYPQSSVGLGCTGYGAFGGDLGAGLLGDPIPPYYPPSAGIANFLGLFAPGVLQNSLTRPPHLTDYSQSSIDNDLQNDPAVDPNYRPGLASVPVRQPNQVFYDPPGAPPLTPAQLVGGISTTVNGIIQQLTGNTQPIYG